MAAQKTTSKLSSKLGAQLKSAHEKHKDDDTEFSQFGELPDGIEHGIAQLVDCKFDVVKEGKQNAGQFYFYAAGVVVKPKIHEGNPIEGLRTSITEPLYPTPTRSRKTLDEHLGWIYNELRKLGVDTKTVNPDNLEQTVEALKQSAPYFKFRTWKGDKATEGQYKDQEPRVQHNWNGWCEFTDTEGSDPATSGVTEPASTAAPVAPAEPEPEMTLEELAAAADGGNEVAQVKLSKMATDAGVPDEDKDAAPNWTVVSELIAAATPDEGTTTTSEAPPEPEEYVPKKGDTPNYSPVDPKTKQPVKKPISCEVMGVDPKTKTVSLKNLVDGKTTYKGVPWDKLS